MYRQEEGDLDDHSQGDHGDPGADSSGAQKKTTVPKKAKDTHRYRRGTHKYPADHGGGAEVGQGGYLLGGEASWAVIWLVVVCNRYGSPGGSRQSFVTTIGMIPSHLRPSGCANKISKKLKIASKASWQRAKKKLPK